MRRLRAHLAAVALLSMAGSAPGYPQYSVNRDATNCRACHGDFRSSAYTSKVDGQNWGNLHDLHRNTMLGGDCNTCHSGSGKFPVSTYSSNGGTGLPAISCVGCHGRAADNNPPTSEYGAGLRQHHYIKGVTVCAGCHADGNPASFTPAPESVLPPYYNQSLSSHPAIPKDPCNENTASGMGENYAGATTGLDNDGDGLFDTADSDCGPTCGNGKIDAGETCDPPSSCPTSCDDGVACTTDAMTGAAATCNVACTHTPITACANGDGCCPAGCTSANDNNCSASCGNGVVDTGETCDPPSSCPTTCSDNDACTTDIMTGAAATCNVACSHTNVTACTNGDGCCPAGCNANNDSNCNPSCGNGVIESGETCDPAASCPGSCDDGDACTTDSSTGAASTCNLACTHTPISGCSDAGTGGTGGTSTGGAAGAATGGAAGTSTGGAAGTATGGAAGTATGGAAGTATGGAAGAATGGAAGATTGGSGGSGATSSGGTGGNPTGGSANTDAGQSGGSGGKSDAGTSGNSGSNDSGGCGCRTAGSNGSGGPAWLLAAFGLSLALRRRKSLDSPGRNSAVGTPASAGLGAWGVGHAAGMPTARPILKCRRARSAARVSRDDPT